MKVSLNWLKEYIPITMSPQELGHMLTMAGLEVEAIEPVGHDLDDVLVARIMSVGPHPKADKLSLCTLDTGGEPIQVVCGAPNLEKGSLVPLAPPGSSLPDGTKIHEGEIRGEISKGMLLAEDEMGLTDDHTGIMILPKGLQPGSSLISSHPLDDWILDLSITPNRPDWTSVIGIAREIAALTGGVLKIPEIPIDESGRSIESLTSVTIHDPGGCPRYAAGMIMDVQPAPSPFWLRYRLHTSGIRSINNIVDVTNYVLLEMGQPLHAFDYDRLKENRIIVNRAKEGDKFTTLDGETRELGHEVLMIMDGERYVALAGIMGGLNSEIFAGTRNILVESAFFDPTTIRRGSKRLGLSTEASYRFERGIDIEGVPTAIRRSLSLINTLAGGEIATGIIDNYPKPFSPRRIALKASHTNRLLGTSLGTEEIIRYIESLNMEVDRVDGDNVEVVPPPYRIDISRDVDLMEEVARMFGYDNIPVTYPNIRPSQKKEQFDLEMRDRAKSIMVGLGFTELITYSFISPESVETLGTDEKSPLKSLVRILNPISTEQSVMRTSLIPGLMNAVRINMIYDIRDLRFFEWGRVFISKEGHTQPSEKLCLAAVMTGAFVKKAWHSQERMVDFFDIKGAVVALLKGLGYKDISFQRCEPFPGYDDSMLSCISYSGTHIGRIGRISTPVMSAYELASEEAYVFELDMDTLLEIPAKPVAFRPIARYPAVYRDISLVVDRRVESGRIRQVIHDRGGDLVESIDIFDLYQGEGIDPSKKAIAFRICYRSKAGTLDGSEVNSLHESIIAGIEKETGGHLREA